MPQHSITRQVLGSLEQFRQPCSPQSIIKSSELYNFVFYSHLCVGMGQST